MGRNKKTKIIMIVALVLAIVTMSAGFAAFSSVLTISSRATVTPNTNFKMKIYGALNPEAESLLDIDMSDTRSVFAASDATVKGTDAIIDNENFTISNISVEATSPGSLGIYMFGVVNEGDLDAFVNLDKFIIDDGKVDSALLNKTCTAIGDTSQSLVDENCNDIGFVTFVRKLDSTGFNLEKITESELDNGYYKITPGMVLYIQLTFLYVSVDVTLADGPFRIDFEDIKFDFVSYPPEA